MQRPKDVLGWLKLAGQVVLLVGLVLTFLGLLLTTAYEDRSTGTVVATVAVGVVVLSLAFLAVLWCCEKGIGATQRRLRVGAVVLLFAAGAAVLACVGSEAVRDWFLRCFHYGGCGQWVETVANIAGGLFSLGLFCFILWHFAAPVLRKWDEGKKASLGPLMGAAFMLLVIWIFVSGWIEEHGPMGWKIKKQLRRLESAEVSQQTSAIDALDDLSGDADAEQQRAIGDALLSAAKDGQDEVREAVADFYQFRLGFPGALDALRLGLQDRKPKIRWKAASGLVKLVEASARSADTKTIEEIAPHVKAALRDTDAVGCAAIAAALCDIAALKGMDRVKYIRREGWADEHDWAATEIKRTLAQHERGMQFLTQVQTTFDEIAAALIRASTWEEKSWRGKAARYLACDHLCRGLGQSTRAAAVAALRKLVRQEDRRVRLDIIRDLKDAGEWAIPVLEIAKSDPDAQLRGEAAEALRQISSRRSRE